ncbi:S1 RNA-binding domain-containing protein [Thermopolyspora sp. NPDC052614]|uniref:S1 RNA-binding domain-containing protein n=1 Tax=Thermopolyspora sp. NPDC052614 TaxID=3155682 RepID=UPI0034339B4E
MNEEPDADAKRDFLTGLEVGQVVRGRIFHVENFGAFVDLGMVEGLITVPQLSWGHIDHPADIVRVGQEVTVTVLDIDLARAQIWLSLKSLQPDPFKDFARTQLDNTVRGQVSKVTPIGVFVRVGEGVEGLLPTSELTRGGTGDRDRMPEVGDEVSVRIATINYGKRRVGLLNP